MVGRFLALGSVLTVTLIAAACSSQQKNSFEPTDPGGGNDGGPGTDSSCGGFCNPTSDGSDLNMDGAISPDALGSCAADTQQGKQLPLDLYIMLDISGSMSQQPNLLGGPTKWQAVKDAITSFSNDSGSAGIGVGLQYFPLKKAGAPASCTQDSDCAPSNSGQCLAKVCQSGNVCHSDADCGGGSGSCAAVGVCDSDNVSACAPVGGGCGGGIIPTNTCKSTTQWQCTEWDSCTSADYATPAFAIAALPGAAAGIKTSLDAHAPNGSTPTSAALQGAVDGAKQYATANPNHTVVAVLATDGLPTECDTNNQNIVNIASTAAGGTPSVKTFAIGIFTATDQIQGKPLLDQIASAGGGTSIALDTSQSNISQQFLDALNNIRGTALPCEYALPVPESGTPDYNKVNVQYTPASGKAALYPYTGGASKCGSADGWYYDVDPSTGGKPTKVILCPNTCSTLKTSGTGKIDILQGCATIGPK